MEKRTGVVAHSRRERHYFSYGKRMNMRDAKFRTLKDNKFFVWNEVTKIGKGHGGITILIK